MRRVLTEVGSEIPDMNAVTQFLKFKLGFADLAEPTPEILKNYMDVSTPAGRPASPKAEGGKETSCTELYPLALACRATSSPLQLLNIIKKLKIISLVPWSCRVCSSCDLFSFLPNCCVWWL